MFFALTTNLLTAQSFTWSTLGNSDITPDNWLGTRNDAMLKDIIIKTDSKERMRIKGGGFFAIGLNNPSNIVHIHNPKNTPSVQEIILDTRNGGGGGTNPSGNTESPYFGKTGLQITNMESGTGTNDGLHIGLRNGMVQGIRLNAIFNLKENADMQFFTNNIHRMTIDRNGNIGIGTSTPQAALHLKKGGNIILFERQGYATFLIQQSAGTGISITRQGTIMPDFYIANNGNVGIGTNNPGNMKIAIEGTLGARAYRITQTNPWPDYVFDNKYELMPLNEIENFIQQNKHLPGIPSANEINENKGYEIGEMQILLLEKIEELYLHVIRLEKENNELRKIICLEK
jgi:hypothetical protein